MLKKGFNDGITSRINDYKIQSTSIYLDQING